MLNKRNIILIFLCFIEVVVMTFSTQAQTPREVLNQYISDLQKNPDDNALREKIIKLVQTMKPAPVVPKEAERFMVRGAAAVKSAKGANDFKDAVAEFEKATLSAPWLANAYYNLGVTQDKAGLYDTAIKNLKLYLLAAPNAPDASSVEKLVYEIEYRQEKTAKESSPEAVAAKKQSEYESWLKKLNGVRFVWNWGESKTKGYSTLEVQGNKLIEGSVTTWCDNAPTTWCGPAPVGQWYRNDETTLNGNEFIFPKDCWGKRKRATLERKD